MPSKRRPPRPAPAPEHPLAERLEHVRTLAGVPSQKDFWRSLGGMEGAGCGYEAVRNYHKDREAPVSYLNRVLDVYTGIDPEWLMRGGNRSPMRSFDDRPIREQWKRQDFSKAAEVYMSAFGLDVQDRSALERLRALHLEVFNIRRSIKLDIESHPGLQPPEWEELNELLAEHIVASILIPAGILLGAQWQVDGKGFLEFFTLYRMAWAQFVRRRSDGEYTCGISSRDLLVELREARDEDKFMQGWRRHISDRIQRRDDLRRRNEQQQDAENEIRRSQQEG
jgi:hypothetical protein